MNPSTDPSECRPPGPRHEAAGPGSPSCLRALALAMPASLTKPPLPPPLAGALSHLQVQEASWPLDLRAASYAPEPLPPADLPGILACAFVCLLSSRPPGPLGLYTPHPHATPRSRGRAWHTVGAQSMRVEGPAPARSAGLPRPFYRRGNRGSERKQPASQGYRACPWHASRSRHD